MKNIDTSNWRKFKISELFEKIPVEKIQGKANDFPEQPSGKYMIPLLTAGVENQGLARYAAREQCPTILKNVISVSANGANTGASFYQDKEFAVLQDSYAIKLIGMDIPNEETGLFLAASLNRLLHGNFSWSNKAGWNHIKELEILLPAKQIDVPDFEYMENYIRELENERISELEKYLVATGLNDYELTEEDKRILSLSTKTRRYEDGFDKDFDGILLKEFGIGDLFENLKIRRKLSKSDLNKKGQYPAYSSETTNGGIIGYTDFYEFSSKNRPFYVIFGDHTRSFNIANTEFSVLDNVKVLSPKFRASQKILLYIISVWKKHLTNEGYARHWKIAQKCLLDLPITNKGDLDFDYMEKYIRAIEKLTMARIYKEKGLIIEKVKEVVNQ